jgi:hypothetical protein
MTRRAAWKLAKLSFRLSAAITFDLALSLLRVKRKWLP